MMNMVVGKDYSRKLLFWFANKAFCLNTNKQTSVYGGGKMDPFLPLLKMKIQ